jgi:hypothetical protein
MGIAKVSFLSPMRSALSNTDAAGGETLNYAFGRDGSELGNA